MWRLYERWAVCLDWVSGEAFRSGPTVPAEEPRSVDETSDHLSDNAARVSSCAKVCRVIAENSVPQQEEKAFVCTHGHLCSWPKHYLFVLLSSSS